MKESKMDNSWSTECDPLEDIKVAIKLVKKQSRNPKLISLSEALYYDTQMLYLSGYDNNQVNEYVKSVKESYNKSLNRTKTVGYF
jgi:hypothetical protein